MRIRWEALVPKGCSWSRGVVLPPSEEPVEEAPTFFRMPPRHLDGAGGGDCGEGGKIAASVASDTCKGDPLEQTSSIHLLKW